MSENYQQFAALLAIAAIIGVIAVRLRQPLIIAFLMTGILVGPAALGWVEPHDQIDLLAQISEFSIIFVAMGITLGHVGVETLGLVTLVGLVTITLSTYLILYSHQLYGRIARWLDVFERANPFRELAMERRQAASDAADVVIYGLGRYGTRLASQLQAQDVRVLGVDFDPEAVRQRRRQGFKVNFGDAEDPEFPQALPLGRLRWIVSTLPQTEINLALLKALRHHGYGGRVAMAAHSDGDSRALAAAGVDRVLSPYSDAADFAARTIAGDLATMKRQP